MTPQQIVETEDAVCRVLLLEQDWSTRMVRGALPSIKYFAEQHQWTVDQILEACGVKGKERGK